MNTMATLGRGVMENAKICVRTQVVKGVGKVMEPLAGTISFMLDLGRYIFQNPDAWKTRHAVYKKELVHESTREYLFRFGGRTYACRESIMTHAIRGKGRCIPSLRFTLREPTEEDYKRLKFEKLRTTVENIECLSPEELRKIKYN